MKYFDAFNGDADGICALHQYRLANPVESELVTGVKRDIKLVGKCNAQSGDVITVFDISFDKNRDALVEHLDNGVEVHYFDHHFAGEIPDNANLSVHIDTSPEICTAIIVNDYLEGKFARWAVVGAFGDSFDALATKVANSINMSDDHIEKAKKLGRLINYNGYGSSLEDLHFAPAELYKAISAFEDPIDFVESSDIYTRLAEGYDEDNKNVDSLKPKHVTDKVALYILPNEKWARRISGDFANALSKQNPDRAHALLTDLGDDNYLVSIRAPAATKTGADELCRQFETGGGRKAAAGINRLPFSDYDLFVERFEKQFA